MSLKVRLLRMAKWSGNIFLNNFYSQIEGSWVDRITFDNQLYWQLDKCHMIKPIKPKHCLPSDCRFREDSVAFGEGDMVWSQKEKERLEEFQRHDRKLREEKAKERGKEAAK